MASSSTTPNTETLKFASELIQIDTSNYGDNQGPGERQAAEYVAGALAEVGIESTLLEPASKRTTLIADWAPEGCDKSVPPLLIHCHTDVVPAAASDWKVHPFSGEIKDGYLWGRGAIDMKGFDAMVLAVIRDRVRQNRPPRRPIRLAFFADEEAAGGLGSIWLTRTHPELIGDCSDAISEVGGFSVTVKDDLRLYLIQCAEKGLHWFKLIYQGVAGHGSMRQPDNAVVKMSQAVARIGSYKFPNKLHPTQQKFLSTIEDLLEIKINFDTVEETLSRLGSVARMVGAAMSNTVNPTGLEAGYKANVVPGQAQATFDGRFLPGQHQEMIDKVMELAGEGMKLETIISAPAYEADYASQLVDAMRYAVQQEDPGAQLAPYIPSTGSDAKNFATELGINCFGFTPLKLPADLDFTALFHGVDERVPVDSLIFGTKVLDHFLDRA